MANTPKNIQTFGQKIARHKKTVRDEAPLTPIDFMKDIASYCQKEAELLFESYNVPDGYRAILTVLAKEDGVSQLTIASATNLKPSTISIALKKMERDDYILRQNDENDLRMSRVFLTERGQKIADDLYNRNAEINTLLQKGLSEEEIATVMQIAQKIQQNCKA